jgi:hypothetical protein
MPCGLSGGYDYVFVGSILSSTPISDFDFLLRLKPQEVFLGNPAGELTVTTSQGACFGDFHPGDEWLFYVSHDKESNRLILNYYWGNISSPAGNAQHEIEFVRRLSRMDGSGTIIGTVQREIGEPHSGFFAPDPNQWIVAMRSSDGQAIHVLTDANGHYELGPLPEGSYIIKVEAVTGTRTAVFFFGKETERVEVKTKSCASVNFAVQATDGNSGAAVKGSP